MQLIDMEKRCMSPQQSLIKNSDKEVQFSTGMCITCEKENPVHAKKHNRNSIEPWWKDEVIKLGVMNW